MLVTLSARADASDAAAAALRADLSDTLANLTAALADTQSRLEQTQTQADLVDARQQLAQQIQTQANITTNSLDALLLQHQEQQAIMSTAILFCVVSLETLTGDSSMVATVLAGQD